MSSSLIGVVAHQSRATRAWSLSSAVDAASVHWDDGERGCERSHIEVLRQLVIQNRELGRDWLVILEDDATPIGGFRRALDAALAEPPADVWVVSLFMQTGNSENPLQQALGDVIERAKAEDAAWIDAQFLCSGVAYAVRAEHAESLLHYLQHSRNVELPLRVTFWARRNGSRVWYAVPNPVDHADVQSTIAPVAIIPPRKSWWFGPRMVWNNHSVVLEGDFPPWTGLSAGAK